MIGPHYPIQLLSQTILLADQAHCWQNNKCLSRRDSLECASHEDPEAHAYR